MKQTRLSIESAISPPDLKVAVISQNDEIPCWKCGGEFPVAYCTLSFRRFVKRRAHDKLPAFRKQRQHEQSTSTRAEEVSGVCLMKQYEDLCPLTFAKIV